MNDKQKEMLLNVTFAAYERLREVERPGSARYTVLVRSIQRILLLIDIYRRKAWTAEPLRKAELLVDEFNARLSQSFSGDDLPAGLNVAFATFESVRAEEQPGSVRYLSLTSGIDRLLELAEIFKPGDWPDELMKTAGVLADEFILRIAEVFGDQPNPEGV